MSNPAPTLTDMPDLVMNIILNKVDFRSIISLQKVCHHLRNFIEDAKPESHLENVSMIFRPKFIQLNMPYNVISAKYQNHQNGCLITGSYGNQRMEKLLENSNFVEIFLNDLEKMLKNQILPIKFFNVQFELFSLEFFDFEEDQFLEQLQRHLSSWSSKIPVRYFTIRCVNQAEIMAILPFLNPNCLEKLDFSRVKTDYVEIDEIVKLDQWKMAKDVHFYKMVISEPLRKFGHFRRVAVVRNSFMGHDLEELREMFLTSNTLESFRVNTRSINNPQFVQILGQPQMEQGLFGSPSHKWVLKDPKKDKNLEFKLSGSFENWLFSVEWSSTR